jgi:hypothetical protein
MQRLGGTHYLRNDAITNIVLEVDLELLNPSIELFFPKHCRHLREDIINLVTIDLEFY